MSGVRAETRMVPPGHGLRFYRDADHVDLARDEHLTATFDDLYGLPDPPPYRRVRGVKPPVSANGRADQRAVADPSPRTSSPAPLGPHSKEQHA